MPKFSIIIPVYNQAEYLPEAIESALAQTVPAEVIVINDGSTDDSLKIADSYVINGAEIKIVNQANKGLASARNTGIMNATGEYILPLDADDILLETCIEKMTLSAEENYTDVISPSFKCFGVRNGEMILDGLPSLNDLLTANRLPYFSAIRRGLLLEVGGYNPRMSLGYEDWDLWIDIFKREKTLCCLQDILVLYRTKETSMLTEADKHRDLLISQMKRNHPTLWPK